MSRQRVPRFRRFILALFAAGLIALCLPQSLPASTHPCSGSVNERATVPRFHETQKIEFQVHESDPVLNFGSDRGQKRDFIVLKASRPIPRGIRSSDFEINSLEPLRRIGTTELESERLPSPRYSRPHLFNHRRELAFNLCLRPTGGDPGTYTGQFLFAGPGAISSVTLTQTAQLKAEEGSFLLPFILIGAITLCALGLRSYSKLDKRSSKKEIFTELVVVLGSAGAALVAMVLIYEETPTWGEKGIVVASAALFAAAFTAAGLGAAVSGGSPKLLDALEKVDKTRNERAGGRGGRWFRRRKPGSEPAAPEHEQVAAKSAMRSRKGESSKL